MKKPSHSPSGEKNGARALSDPSIRCHSSQIIDAGFFASMPDERVAMAVGTEWFIRHGADHALRDGGLFE